jgi:hypothetical protein
VSMSLVTAGCPLQVGLMLSFNSALSPLENFYRTFGAFLLSHNYPQLFVE